MLPLSSIVSNHIRFLLNGATDSSSDSIFRELIQLVECGTEESILLLQTCLDQLNSGGEDAKNLQMQRDLVSAIFKYLLDKPNFCSIFYKALHGPVRSDVFLGDLAKALNLSIAEKIGVGLALSESENLDFRTRGHNFCIAEIEDLITNPNMGVPIEKIQDIVLFLCRSEGLSKHVDSFTKILSLIPHNGSSFVVQTPIFMDDISAVNSLRQLDQFYEGSNDDFEAVLAEIEQEMSMADILRELGYGCTFSTTHCKEMLSLSCFSMNLHLPSYLAWLLILMLALRILRTFTHHCALLLVAT